MTSLHRRLTVRFRSFRAEPFEAGPDDYNNLELYLNTRGNGLTIETPTVRYWYSAWIKLTPLHW